VVAEEVSDNNEQTHSCTHTHWQFAGHYPAGALDVLKSADLILAEDTRTTRKLLQHFEIETPLQSFHMHNEHKVVERYVAEIAGGQNALPW
jgi:16S rRNA C1402 (ribose-2'-O) methylase RsmI